MLDSPNVRRLTLGDKEIIVLGTAHVSQRSVEEVRALIEEVQPDTVCVELDATRHAVLMDESQWKNLDIFQIIREKKVLLLLANVVLSSYQRRMAKQLGVRPGAELKAAVEMAEEVGAELVLADRNIQATLKRTWANLSFWNKAKVSAAMVNSIFSAGEISEEQIEQLKDRDTISEAMQELARAMPQVKTPLIDERDQYLMSSAEDAPGKRIVVVVGAGHVEGMAANLGKPVDRKALEEIPPAAFSARLLKWIIPAIVLGAFYWGYREHAAQGLGAMLYAWLISNSVGAAVFSVAAGAKPLTILVALLLSPITSLNPTVSTGMVAGLVEAGLRRPTVEDCERINEDMTSLRGLYHNRFTRVLLVAFLSSVGSAVGAWVGASWVVALL